MKSSRSGTASGAKTQLAYPQARRCGQVDHYFGTAVADPYRWLENPDSEETRHWVDEQIALSQSFFAGIPVRNAIGRRAREVFDYDSYGAPYKRGKRTFFVKQTGLANHPVHYVIDEEGGQPRALFDPNQLSEDGTVALSSFRVSEDGNYVAYGLSYSGSDWVEMRVLDVATGVDLEDHLRWIKFSSPSWSRDGRGFYYARFDEPADLTAVPYYQKVYFHELGNRQEDDTLIFESQEHKDWHFSCGESEDGRYLILYISSTTSDFYRVYYKDLAESGDWVKLLDKEDAHWTFSDNEGPVFWFFTDLDAPRGRLVAIDISKSTPENLVMQDVIGEPENERTIFEGVATCGGRFFAHYSTDVHTEIEEVTRGGELIRQIPLPGLGSAGGFHGKHDDSVTYYSFTSYTMPPTIFRYDITTGESSLYFKPDIPVDTSKYMSKLVFVASKDGTRVPMFISYRKGLKRNGKNPTLLYGYGGFGISLGPMFAGSRTIWMDMGGIYAEAILRGGGEYGEEWHRAGTKLDKQNVFDDFIACAEWLIAERYTSTPKLAINGGSNGGLLVGAVMTQRYDLFGACVPEVGVMDMLRFDQFTAGVHWRADYGSAQESEEEFTALFAYSPYHNIRPDIQYPPTLVMTADHDDRVVPGHSLKFGARVQWAQAGGNPILIRIEKKAGHGAGMPLTKRLEAIADRFAFLVEALEIPRRKWRWLLR